MAHNKHMDRPVVTQKFESAALHIKGQESLLTRVDELVDAD
jgi:hypothetical protein